MEFLGRIRTIILLTANKKPRKDTFNHRIYLSLRQWITLEYALFEWQQRAQLAKLPLSGQIVKEKTSKFGISFLNPLIK